MQNLKRYKQLKRSPKYGKLKFMNDPRSMPDSKVPETGVRNSRFEVISLPGTTTKQSMVITQFTFIEKKQDKNRPKPKLT